MEKKAILLATTLMLAQIAQVFCTSPAFLFSPLYYGVSKDTVNYQTLSPNNLVNAVLDFVCPANKENGNVDIALVFIGRKLHSSDISKSNQQDPLLTDTLKSSFTSSKFSIAFPYVDTSNNDESLEKELIKGFSAKCHENIMKLKDLNSIQEHVASNIENKKLDLILYNHEGVQELEGGKSEGEMLSEIIGLLNKSGAKYTVLYASEPYWFDQSHLGLTKRNLLEDSSNSTATTCDEICRMKASLLEGILVGITLLIILISGLCCMMGIDTPSRFETPQES